MKRVLQNLTHDGMFLSEIHLLPLKTNNYKQMKKFFIYFPMLLVAAVLVSSCDQTKLPDDPFPSEEIEGCYIVNYGSYGAGGATISKYDYKTDEMSNSFYQSQNDGNELLSNIQFAYHHEDSVFLIGNSTDQLITVNPFIEQSLNGVTTDIANPRFCVADGDYLYISCLGANPDWATMPDSYIAKYNIVTRKVEKKIALPGGPEGLEIANGKLYAAMNYKNAIAIINLSNETVSEISTPAVSSYFVKDADGNLYFTQLSTYNNFSTETGIGYINTSTDKLETVYSLDKVSSNYGSMLQANSDFSKIYVVTDGANWGDPGAISVFDVANKKFDDNNFVSDISGISGLAVNTKTSDIYIFSAQSTTGVGMMHIYSSTGNFEKEYEVGAFPVGAFFLE